MIKNFLQLEKAAQRLKPVRMVVVSAEDEKVLAGVKLALKKMLFMNRYWWAMDNKSKKHY